MKFKILIITILIEVAVSTTINQIDGGIDGVLIKRTYLREMRALGIKPRLTCPANILGHVCADDCQTLMACQTGQIKPILTVNCADVTENMPYCIPGADHCTNTTDYINPQCIAAQRSTFRCTSTGYFPDPTDCTLYHICTREFQETYQCPPQYVFDAPNTKCQLEKRCQGCMTINCTNSLNQYVHYQGHKSYYAYCSKDDITMFKCGDTNHFEFNPKTANCDFVCKSSGWFPNYKNCQQYYECYKTKMCSDCGEKIFKYRIQTCPPYFIFDAERRQCIEGDCFTNSNQPTTFEPTTTDMIYTTTISNPPFP